MVKPEKYLSWIIIIFGVLSFLRFLGLALTYTSIQPLHNIGNYLFLALLLPFHPITFFIGAFIGIFIFVFLWYKKVDRNVALIPLFFSLLTAINWIISFVSDKIFGIPAYNSAIAENFIFQTITNNYFVMGVYLVIFIYSIFVLKQISSKAK
jgi:hypothetical protein